MEDKSIQPGTKRVLPRTKKGFSKGLPMETAEESFFSFNVKWAKVDKALSPRDLVSLCDASADLLD